MRIYFDNNATTEIHPEVLALLERELKTSFGNASSIHHEGQRARRVLEGARDSVSALIGARGRDLVFTSGGTESNNSAIFGKALSAESGCHIVTTTIEHPSVSEPILELERRGHGVTRVPPDADGVISAAAIEDSLRSDTKLVVVMLANNETGALQPVADVAKLCRPRQIHLHTDAVQACGKIAVDVEELGVDSLSLAAHKMHGPKGIGALYVREGTKVASFLVGGAQERRRRAGTENAPLAAAFGAAAGIASLVESGTMAVLRDRIEVDLMQAFPVSTINSGKTGRLPNTSNICFRDHDGESIVIALDLAGIAVSTGSACSSGRIEPSHVLIAMGLSEEDARSSVRISLSRLTTASQVETALRTMRELIPRSARDWSGREQSQPALGAVQSLKHRKE
ncbi:MAG TPA: cysteine desulfurase family protein [Thermoanaerobaculia bacterium]|nr:cysteine desulfurase family protein [Thermoanaerobaculia bacterium]